MPSWRALKTSAKWFTHADLYDLKTERYFELDVEVLRVEQGEAEQPNSGRKQKLPALFAKALRSGVALPKPLGLNTTNALAIESLVGSDDYKKWPGTRVTFFVIMDARDPNGGGKRPAIRIKPCTAQTQGAPPPGQPPASDARTTPPSSPPPSSNSGGFTSEEIREIERIEAEEAARQKR